MKCKSCKRDIPDESIFCLHCGRNQVQTRAEKKKEITVPKPTQLADGRWKTRIMVDGVRTTIYGSTPRECEAAARAAKAGAIEVEGKKFKTLSAAIDDFLKNNENLLDPSTVRSYHSNREHRFQHCMNWNIYDPSCNWQKAINDEAGKVSGKTVRNAWGLITSTMTYFKVPHPTVKLPKKKKAERAWLNYKEIDVFLAAIRGQEFELAALMALHSMRLSELIAVRPENVDLKKEEIRIRGARVLNKNKKIVFKELNKTEASCREIPIVIPRLLELLTPEVLQREWVADYSEKRLYDKINKVCEAAKLPLVGVHGLRHSFASLAYHLGWQKLSTMKVGGWTNSKIVDEIYTHNADLDRDIKRMKRFYKGK